MLNHLSEDCFVIHMNLLKQAITEHFEDKIKFLKRRLVHKKHKLETEQAQSNAQRAQINDLKRKVAQLEHELQPHKFKKIMVNGCGICPQ